jgi:hypothetical protein
MKIRLTRIDTHGPRSKGLRTSKAGDALLQCLEDKYMPTPPWGILMRIASMIKKYGSRFWFTEKGWNRYGQPCVRSMRSAGMRVTAKTVEVNASEVGLIDEFQALYPIAPSAKYPFQRAAKSKAQSTRLFR